MAQKASKWIELFHEFIKPLRIFSKEMLSHDDQGVPLQLWDSQKRFLDELAAGLEDGVRSFICLKSRQLGITTVSLVIDVFWCAMFPGTRAALVSDTESNRDENRSIIEGYVKSFPKHYFGDSFRIVKANRSFMEFSNGSRITFLVAGTKKKGVSWAEGKGYSFAHCTEVSKYGDLAALKSFQESLAQANPDRLFIYESTANGMNHFKTMWEEAKRDTTTQRAFFIGWWASDVNWISKDDKRWDAYGTYSPSGEEREKVRAVRQQYGYVIKAEQLAWARWKASDQSQDINILSQNQPWIEQEAFVESGYSFFQTRLLNQQIMKMEADCKGGSNVYDYKPFRYEVHNDFWTMEMIPITKQEERPLIQLRVWQEPVETGKYAIGCDPAYGRSEQKDRSAISVWRCYADKMVQVAEFASNTIEVKHCAWILAHLAGAYRDCICNVELTGPGRLVMTEWDHIRAMLKSEYYSTATQDRGWQEALDYARWFLYHRQDQMGFGCAYNFESNWRTKQELLFGYRGAFMTGETVWRSRQLIEEMMVVRQDENEIGAPDSQSETCKDDRVFAAALATRAWLNWIRPGMIAAGQTYDVVTKEESGELTKAARNLNDQVYRFFARREEEADLPPPKTWKEVRGLA